MNIYATLNRRFKLVSLTLTSLDILLIFGTWDKLFLTISGQLKTNNMPCQWHPSFK